MSEKIKNITSLIRNRLGIEHRPTVGIILGSGLGDLADRIEVEGRVAYDEIEGFPVSTVVGHAGELIYGRLAGEWVVAMRGRVHYYEGYTMEQVVLPTRVLCGLGIKTLIVSNAAGGLNETFEVGDIMLIEDHINLLPNPLIGPNDNQLGVRFPAMNGAYAARWRECAQLVAQQMGIGLKSGVYLALSGPSYETPAENRFFRTIGADAVGMSTTPEVIVARHEQVEVFGLSLITNIGLGEKAQTASHEEVFTAAKAATGKVCRLVERVIERMSKE